MSNVLNRPATRRLAALTSAVTLVVVTTASPALAAPNPAIYSQSTAQALAANVPLLGLTVNQSPTPTSSVYGTTNVAVPAPAPSSTSSDVIATGAPLISALGNETLITAGALSEYTEATSVGDGGASYACAGTVQPNGAVQIGADKTSCSSTLGTAPGGATIDLSQITGLSGVIDAKLTLDSVTAFASDKAGQTGGTLTQTALGQAGVTGGSLVITLLSGLIPAITVNLTSVPTGPNSDLLPTVTAALGTGLTAAIGALNLNALLQGIANTVLTPAAALLSTTLANVVQLTSNYEPSDPTPDPATGLFTDPAASAANIKCPSVNPTPGSFLVSGLHICVLGSTVATADVAKVTVGPNALAPAGPAFPVEGLPIAGGAAILLALFIVPWYRRRRRAMNTTA